MKKLYEPHDILIKKISKFALTGIFVTGIHVIVAFSFLNYVAPIPTLANGTAFLIAAIVSYVINTLWTFSGSLLKRNLYRFSVVSAICGTLAVSVSGMAEHYGLSHAAGIGLVVLILPAVSFLLHHFWTYNETGNELGKKS